MNILNGFKTMFSRKPDFIIGNRDNPYMLRWYIIPRNRFFNIYLHKILKSDDDRALHDHPWASLSIILKGRYIEWTHNADEDIRADLVGIEYGFSSPIYRGSNYAHRLEVKPGEHCWTLFFTGPKLREWGFYCPRGWVPWFDFVDSHDHGNTGRGCGEQ